MRYALAGLLAAASALVGAQAPAPVAADIAWVASGAFCEPETVYPLPDDTLLVSNVCGFREAGNGYLSLLAADGTVRDARVVDGLDAPLGMAFVNARLYVVDANRVRVFRWPGYEPLAVIALDTAVANDIAVGLDGTFYVSDSARDQVLMRTPDGKQSVLTGQARFKTANGMALRDNHLFVGGVRLWCVDLATEAVTTIGPDWFGDIDGIEFEPDGTLQITPVGGPLIRYRDDENIVVLAGPGISSTNHGYAPRLGLALIPTGFANTVIAVRVP